MKILFLTKTMAIILSNKKFKPPSLPKMKKKLLDSEKVAKIKEFRNWMKKRKHEKEIATKTGQQRLQQAAGRLQQAAGTEKGLQCVSKC